MKGRLLDDFRDDEEAVGLQRGIAQGLFLSEAGTGDIRPGDIHQRERVRGRVDAGDIDAAQLLDVPEDVSELGAEALFLLGGQLEPGEVGDVVDVEIVGGHGSEGREGAWAGPSVKSWSMAVA